VNTTDPEYVDIRAFIEVVAATFRALHPSREPAAVLEAADAGASFEHDLVRVKFRMRGRNEVNARGLIVTVDSEAGVPEDVHPADVARLISKRLAALDVVQSTGKISRIEYTTLTLGELLRDDA
jgi:hypothetical protein